jgi:broad-specificity NMP kinase
LASLSVSAIEGKLVLELIIIRGLPGSGKTTLAKKIAANHGFVHHEVDHYFEGTEGYVFVPARLGSAIAWCQEKVRSSLANGCNTVVSNVFTKLSAIQEYRDIASEFGAVVTVLECEGDYGSVHPIPSAKLARMRRNFERQIA